MTTRSYAVRLEANVVGFIAQVGVQAVAAVNKLEAAATSAGRKVDDLGNRAAGIGPKINAGIGRGVERFDDLAARIDKNSHNLETLGRGATRMGVTAAAGIGLAAKAAVDWESAWAGVTKTVDGTTTQMAALQDQLRGMARSLPETHEQIAAVAEAAGQLGVRREDIASFTKVMVDLGETTNLTSDEAATSLAQFMNVMGTAPENVNRLGAAVVALGNDGASTERDIVAMAQRISGSGKIIGLTETQVLGFAAALSNVGIEAEAGGSAISTIFTKIDQAVSQGGEHLANFATVSGQTSSQFKQNFEKDAAGATLAFIQGIGAINDAGQDVNGTLETLGITEIRQRDAVLRLAASGTNLADSLKVSADGWRENTALVDEASKRYATTESQIRIAWNNIKDAAITAGSEMLPVIAGIAGNVADLAKWFGDLPGPVRSVITGLAGVVAVGGLVAGAGVKMVTSISAARVAMVGLGADSKRTATALSLVGKGGIAIGVALGLKQLADALAQVNAATHQMDIGGLSADLLRFGETGKVTGELAKNFGDDLNGAFRDIGSNGRSLAAALLQATEGNDSFIEKIKNSTPGFHEYVDRVKEIDQALASLVEGGNADSAGKAVAKLAQENAKYGITQDTLLQAFPKYQAALKSAAVDAEVAGDKAGGAAGPTSAYAEALGMTGKQAESAADRLQDYISTLYGLPNLLLGVRDAQRGVQAAIDDATASIKENGRTLNIGTEKGRANQEALDAIATSANKLSEAYVRSDASQKTINAGVREAQDAYVNLAVKMGMGREEARAYAEQFIKVPDKKATEVSNNAGPDQKPAKDAKSYAEILAGTLPTVHTVVTNNAGAQPKTAAERYAEILRGTLPQVSTVVSNNAPGAAERWKGYLTVLGLTPPSKSTSVSTPGAAGAAGQVDNLLGLLGALPPSKTVTIKTIRQTLETVTHVDVGVRAPGRADGGPLPGSSPNPRADNILFWGTAGEWVHSNASVDYYGPGFMKAVETRQYPREMAQGYADGGQIGHYAAGGPLAGGKLVDIAYLLQQLGLPFNPTAGVNYAGALASLNKANAAAAPARTTMVRAEAAESAAKAEVARIQRAITLQQRYVTQLRQQGASEAKIRAEQKETIGLQDQLFRAKQRVTAATKASSAADEAYKKKADAAKTAAQNYKDALEKLVEQQRAAVELAQQVASGLTGSADLGDLFDQSLTGKGLLADLQDQGAQLSKFRGLIDQLRKQKLDEDLINQIIGKGAGKGSEIAQAILSGGLSLVDALNKAEKALDDQANLIGAGVATAQYGVKVTGARAGGGPVSAGSTYRVNEDGTEYFTAPIDGYVIPHAVDPARYIQSLPGNRSGSASSAPTVVREIHQTINNHGVSMAEADLIASRAQAKLEFMART
ncbi:phage tail tape measure protein [Kribbella sp. NPDC051587]|uniref:phage tail tape measure protein n=1 Tax=Kribbella sp. NPDC051587 TaxID=3364119 RepID=UPI003794EE31